MDAPHLVLAGWQVGRRESREATNAKLDGFNLGRVGRRGGQHVGLSAGFLTSTQPTFNFTGALKPGKG